MHSAWLANPGDAGRVRLISQARDIGYSTTLEPLACRGDDNILQVHAAAWSTSILAAKTMTGTTVVQVDTRARWERTFQQEPRSTLHLLYTSVP
jgi:hypothetical protein